jgi:menaquinone-dependent protoporphyrinogen IX oxidase
VFDDREYVEFLKSINKSNVKEFVSIGLTVYERKFLNSLKMFVKKYLYLLRIKKMQFWGYQRTIDEQIRCYSNAGFKNITYGKLKNGVYWIRSINE